MRPALALLGLALAGCASVPLSTMVRMSTFDPQDFVALDPEVLRVRVTLPRDFALDAGSSWLGVELNSPAGVHSGEFKLAQEASQPSLVSAGLFAGETPATAYTLKLADASRAEFRRLQAFVAQGKPEDVTIRVVPILSSYPPDVPSTRVWIDLRLTQAQGYFTLLDGATLPLDRIREASATRARP